MVLHMEPGSPDLASGNGQPAGLPPVRPPSGRHIVQLFVVPGIIVGVVVVILLGCTGAWSWLLGFSGTAEENLADLQSSNIDVRWRAAERLAQILKRDENMASDPKVGLKLAEILALELDGLQKAAKDKKERKERREFIQYVSALLGNMTLPAGAPQLVKMAGTKEGEQPTTAALRRHAVWMLANLGENMKRYQQIPQERRDQILAELEKEASSGQLTRRETAQQLVDYLKGKKDLGVVAVLAECGTATDPDLRMLSAFALAHWQGSPTENEQAEAALIQLALDKGEGQRILLGKDD